MATTSLDPPKVMCSIIFEERTFSCHSGQDFAYDQRSITQDMPQPNFELQEMGTQTTQFYAIPRDDLHDAFLGSSSQLLMNARMEAVMDPSTLVSYDTLPEVENIIHFPADVSSNFDEPSLAYFLNGIMTPPLPVPETHKFPPNQSYLPRTPRDLLDFGIFNLDSFDMDMIVGEGRLYIVPTSANSMPLKPLPASATQTPSFGNRIASGNAAFMHSVWR